MIVVALLLFQGIRWFITSIWTMSVDVTMVILSLKWNIRNFSCSCELSLQCRQWVLLLPWRSTRLREQRGIVVAMVIYPIASTMTRRCCSRDLLFNVVNGWSLRMCSSAMLVAVRPSLPFWRIIYQSTEFAQWRLTRWEYIGVEASVGETDSSILMFEGWISSVVLSRVITWKR